MADQESPPKQQQQQRSTKKKGAAGKKAQGRKKSSSAAGSPKIGSGSGSGSGGSATQVNILRIIDTNAAPHEGSSRPGTPADEMTRSTAVGGDEEDKENGVAGMDEKSSTPRRTRSLKTKTVAPESSPKVPDSPRKPVEKEGGSTPSKIARPKPASMKREEAAVVTPSVEVNGVGHEAEPEENKEKTKENESQNKKETQKHTDTADAETTPDTRQEQPDTKQVERDTRGSKESKDKDAPSRKGLGGLVDGAADTQEDFAGLPIPKSNGSALKRTLRDNQIQEVADPDTKFPGWDEYPPLSIDENDQESRQRELAYYRAIGVRFAPWNIPFKRRLQTLAVLMHSLSIASTVSFFFFLCAIPLTWPLLVPYLLHMLLSRAASDGRLRFRSERFRRLPVWKFFADYYPARLHKTHELPPTRKYIFGYHPHGIISHGAFAAFATESLGFSEKFPGITNSLLTLDSNFRIPLYREYILSLGIQSVSKESITNILSHGGRNGEGMGRAVTIVIGGARESLEAQPGTMHLVLGERKGFVKLAVRTGADIVPVLAFGENDLYDQVSPKTHPSLHRLQMFVLRTLKFTLPFLHGRGIFNYDVGLMPYRRPLNIVVGRPIKVVKARGEPDMAEVERLHRAYVDELRKMWDRYKDEFAPHREEEMVILK